MNQQCLKRGKLTIEVAGGLGNQLFCYFAGFYFAQELKSNLEVDLLYSAKSHSRKYNLTSFKLEGKFKNNVNEPIKELKKFGWRLSDSLAYRNNFFRQIRQELLHVFVEQPRSEYEPNLVQQLHQKQRVKGFFTTSKYLELLQKNDKFLTLELKEPSEWFLNMADTFLKNRPISVHIRRGDFLAEKSTHGVLSEEYYGNALAIATTNFPNSPIYVFTNDLQGVQKWTIFSNYSVTFIERIDLNGNNDLDDPAEHLKLMALSRVNIVANSSFSLFAAMLNPSVDLVIRPEPVAVAAEYNLKNFFPRDWKSIPAIWEK